MIPVERSGLHIRLGLDFTVTKGMNGIGMTERFVYLVGQTWHEQRMAYSAIESAGMLPLIYEGDTDFRCRIPRLRPGCVVADSDMPRIDVFALIAALEDCPDRFPVMVIAANGDKAMAVDAITRGAANCLEEPFDARLLTLALTQAFGIRDHNARADNRKNAAMARMNGLSDRERTVFQGLARGRSNKILAYDLGLSIRTIEMHRSNLMHRLGVHTLAEAMTLAFASGTDLQSAPQ